MLLVRWKFENPFEIMWFCLRNGFQISRIFYYCMWSICKKKVKRLWRYLISRLQSPSKTEVYCLCHSSSLIHIYNSNKSRFEQSNWNPNTVDSSRPFFLGPISLWILTFWFFLLNFISNWYLKIEHYSKLIDFLWSTYTNYSIQYCKANFTFSFPAPDPPASSCPIDLFCLNGGKCLYYEMIGELVCR